MENSATSNPKNHRPWWQPWCASRKVMLLWLAVLCAVILLSDLGAGSLRNWDEGIYAACSREMHQRDSWMTLYFNGKPWINKPPLYFWMTRVCFLLFGFNEWAVRLPSALCGVGLVFTLFLLGEAMFNRQVGFLAATILMSTHQFLAYAKQGQLDVPLAFFTTVSIYFFWMGRSNPRLYLISGLAAGLACMTKQLVGWLPLPVVFFYLLFRRDWKTMFHSWLLAGGLLAVLMIGPWVLHQYRAFSTLPDTIGGDHFMKKFFGYHVTSRLTEGVQSKNTAMIYYIKDVMLKKNRGPMVLLIVIVMAAAVALRRGELRIRPPDCAWTLVWVWPLFIFIFFTAATSKAKWYLVPFYPALALLLAAAAVRCIPQKRIAAFASLVGICILATALFSRQVRQRNFNPALKAAAPLITDLVAPGDSVILFNPPETEPAIGFYVPRHIDAIGETDMAVAYQLILQRIDKAEDPSTIVIVSRAQAWDALLDANVGELPVRELARFPTIDPDETVLLFGVKP